MALVVVGVFFVFVMVCLELLSRGGSEYWFSCVLNCRCDVLGVVCLCCVGGLGVWWVFRV